MRPSMWSAVPEIAELQFANDPSKPLSLAPEKEVERAFASIAQQIADLAEAIGERSAAAAPRLQGPRSSRGKAQPSGPPTGSKGHLFVSHSEDGDFAELLKLKLVGEGHEARGSTLIVLIRN